MNIITRFIMPLVLAAWTYLLMAQLGGKWVDNIELQGVMGSTALLLGLLLGLISQFIIQAETQNGFALLKNRRVLLPQQLKLTDIMRHNVIGWIPFTIPLHTTICIYTPDEWRYIDVVIERELAKDHAGKIVAAHLDKAAPILEERLQKTIFAASQQDSSFAEFFAKNQLMNDEDIQIFKSKLLSAIERDQTPGVEYGISPSSIHIKRTSMKRVNHLGPIEEPELDFDLSFPELDSL